MITNDAHLLVLKQQAEKIKNLEEEKTVLLQEVDFYKSQVQAYSGFIESITNKGQVFLKDAATSNWLSKLDNYLNEVRFVDRGPGVPSIQSAIHQ